MAFDKTLSADTRLLVSLDKLLLTAETALLVFAIAEFVLLKLLAIIEFRLLMALDNSVLVTLPPPPTALLALTRLTRLV